MEIRLSPLKPIAVKLFRMSAGVPLFLSVKMLFRMLLGSAIIYLLIAIIKFCHIILWPDMLS